MCMKAAPGEASPILGRPARQRQAPAPPARRLDVEPEPKRVADVLRPVIVRWGGRQVVVIQKWRCRGYIGEAALGGLAEAPEVPVGRGGRGFVSQQGPDGPGLG